MKEFSDLVGRIYDAALTPDLWNNVLARVRAYVHTETAAFNSYDADDRVKFSWQYIVRLQSRVSSDLHREVSGDEPLDWHGRGARLRGDRVRLRSIHLSGYP